MYRRCGSVQTLLVALAVWLGPGRALAQQPGTPEPAAPLAAPTTATDRSGTETASDVANLGLKEATERGIRLFQQGDYDGAIVAFNTAYVISPNPMFLFNIAQAHRKSGHLDEALVNYQLFLRKAPDSPLRPETEAYIELVRAQKQQKPAPLPAPPTAPVVVAAPAPGPVVDAPKPTPLYKRGWVWGTVGAAVAVATGIAVGVYFGTRPPSPSLGYVEPTF